MRALITGGQGQLACELVATAPSEVLVRAVSRAECDITELPIVEKAFRSFRPDIVINTAAFTAVDAAEGNEELAFQVNARGAETVAKVAELVGSKLIHISTDYVFDGESTTPYPPDAQTRPINIYGKSKLAGEEAVRGMLPESLIVRSGWLYSTSGKNFLLRILELARKNDVLRIVRDQRGTPTLARDFARILWLCAARPHLHGTYHFANSGEASWYEFACEIQSIAVEHGMLPGRARITPISSAQHKAPARRPRYSVLDSTSLLNVLNSQQRSWQSALQDVVSGMARNVDTS